jgi:hypothetical protein
VLDLRAVKNETMARDILAIYHSRASEQAAHLLSRALMQCERAMDKLHFIVALNHERKTQSDTFQRTSSYMDDGRD